MGQYATRTPSGGVSLRPVHVSVDRVAQHAEPFANRLDVRFRRFRCRGELQCGRVDLHGRRAERRRRCRDVAGIGSDGVRAVFGQSRLNLRDRDRRSTPASRCRCRASCPPLAHKPAVTTTSETNQPRRHEGAKDFDLIGPPSTESSVDCSSRWIPEQPCARPLP